MLEHSNTRSCCVVYSHFCVKAAELSSYNRDEMDHKAYSTYYLVFCPILGDSLVVCSCMEPCFVPLPLPEGEWQQRYPA